jgi:hypothetical protein
VALLGLFKMGHKLTFPIDWILMRTTIPIIEEENRGLVAELESMAYHNQVTTTSD